MRSIIIVAGLVACIILGISWVNALANLPEVTTTITNYLTGRVEYVVSPEEVTEYRNQVNTTHGIWLALIIGSTGGLFYIANEKDKKTKEVEKWWKTEGRTEYENLTANSKGVNSEKIIEKDSYNYDETLVNRAKERKSACPMWTTSQITKELIKEGFEIDSEDQIEYLLKNTRENPSLVSKSNKKPEDKLIRKMEPEYMKEDVYENIEKLGGLLEKGYITQEEFDEKKKKLLDQI